MLVLTGLTTSLKKTREVKKGLVVKILGRTNRTHSKLVRDFSKKLLTGIFGCPKLHVGQKKLKKKISYFFHFS